MDVKKLHFVLKGKKLNTKICEKTGAEILLGAFSYHEKKWPRGAKFPQKSKETSTSKAPLLRQQSCSSGLFGLAFQVVVHAHSSRTLCSVKENRPEDCGFSKEPSMPDRKTLLLLPSRHQSKNKRTELPEIIHMSKSLNRKSKSSWVWVLLSRFTSGGILIKLWQQQQGKSEHDFEYHNLVDSLIDRVGQQELFLAFMLPSMMNNAQVLNSSGING